MDEFRPNSHKSKEAQKTNSTAEKRVDGKVISGSAKIKKKSDIRKFADIFIAEDLQSIKDYIWWDVLIPYAKDTIEDVIHVILRGKDSAPRRKTAASKVSYGRFFEKNERKEYAPNKARAAFDYGDIVFESRGDAEVVLSAMDEVIQQFGVVSVGDLYDLAEVTTTNYAVNKYGWTDIHNASVIGNPREGYTIKLPRALPLD